MEKPVCVVVGVGPGNGSSLATQFASNGYQVVLLSRSEETVREYEKSIPDATGYVCDATDTEVVEKRYAKIREDCGPIDTLIYNAGSGVWGTFAELDAKALEDTFRVNAVGLFLAAKQVVPDMLSAGRGTIGVIGASAAWRGRAKTLAFAAAKAAQRSVAQSLGRDLGPKGIHTFYVTIDGVIDTPRTREMMNEKPDDLFLDPDHIAQAVWNVAQQPRSAWTFELDLRPFGENW